LEVLVAGVVAVAAVVLVAVLLGEEVLRCSLTTHRRLTRQEG
jgi:hypothetical protein